MIDYSLGNFLGYRGFGLGGNLSTSAVLQATITAGGKFVTARLRPVELDGDGVPSPGGYGISLVKTVSAEDFGASAARISATGVIAPPSDLNWPSADERVNSTEFGAPGSCGPGITLGAECVSQLTTNLVV